MTQYRLDLNYDELLELYDALWVDECDTKIFCELGFNGLPYTSKFEVVASRLWVKYGGTKDAKHFHLANNKLFGDEP